MTLSEDKLGCISPGYFYIVIKMARTRKTTRKQTQARRTSNRKKTKKEVPEFIDTDTAFEAEKAIEQSTEVALPDKQQNTITDSNHQPDPVQESGDDEVSVYPKQSTPVKKKVESYIPERNSITFPEEIAAEMIQVLGSGDDDGDHGDVNGEQTDHTEHSDWVILDETGTELHVNPADEGKFAEIETSITCHRTRIIKDKNQLLQDNLELANEKLQWYEHNRSELQREIAKLVKEKQEFALESHRYMELNLGLQLEVQSLTLALEKEKSWHQCQPQRRASNAPEVLHLDTMAEAPPRKNERRQKDRSKTNSEQASGSRTQVDQPNAIIIGDSMVRGLRMPNSTTFVYGGATIERIISKISSTLPKDNTVKYLAVHVGTNNVKHDGQAEIIDKFDLLCKEIQNAIRRPRGTEVILSGIYHRADSPAMNRKIAAVNNALELLCERYGFIFMENNDTAANSARIYKADGLHLNQHGFVAFQNRLLRHSKLHSHPTNHRKIGRIKERPHSDRTSWRDQTNAPGRGPPAAQTALLRGQQRFPCPPSYRDALLQTPHPACRGQLQVTPAGSPLRQPQVGSPGSTQRDRNQHAAHAHPSRHDSQRDRRLEHPAGSPRGGSSQVPPALMQLPAGRSERLGQLANHTSPWRGQLVNVNGYGMATPPPARRMQWPPELYPGTQLETFV